VTAVFAVFKVALGAVLYGAAAAAVFVLADARLGRSPAILLLALSAGVVPLALAAVLVRGFRKSDPGTRFISTLAGTAGVLSVLLLLGIGALLRGPLAQALTAAPERYPALGDGARHALATLGRWLAPSAAAPGASTVAGDTVAPGPRTAPTPASEPVPTRAPEPRSPPAGHAAIDVKVCDRVMTISTASLGGSDSDQIVVGCDEDVHVLWARPLIPAVVERTVIRTRAPEGQEAILRDERVVDVDGDGLLDVLTCVLVAADSGGTRGGGVWLHRGLPGGLFAPGTALYRSACGGVDLGDVTGGGRVDLLVASVGNPYREDNPNGQLIWMARTGRARFVRRGAQPLLMNPIALWLADVNQDGVLDVVVNHGWDNNGSAVLPGSSRGPGPMDQQLTPPPEPNRHLRIQARLDGDAQLDAVGPAHAFYDGMLRIELSAAPPSTAAAILPASDRQVLED
jgi:hypothetical protein